VLDIIVILIYFAVPDVASVILSYFILDRISERTALNNEGRVLYWIGLFCGLVFVMIMILVIVGNLITGRVPSLLDIILGSIFLLFGAIPPSAMSGLQRGPLNPSLMFLATLLIGIFFESRHKPRTLQGSE